MPTNHNYHRQISLSTMVPVMAVARALVKFGSLVKREAICWTRIVWDDEEAGGVSSSGTEAFTVFVVDGDLDK